VIDRPLGIACEEMSEESIQDFEQFWPYYLNEHARPATRWFHFVGTNVAVATLIYAVATMTLPLFPAAIISGYAFAWVSHFFIEKNRPATFKYPAWSFKADMKLCKLMWMGKLSAELDKHLRVVSSDTGLAPHS
jgi:hypothetical protein